MKEYYNNCINQYIRDLIAEKDVIAEDICNIATYINNEKTTQDLGVGDISGINKRRNDMCAIYQLIEDLEKLRK